MKLQAAARIAHDLSKPYRVTAGSKFRLEDHDPGDTRGIKSKEQALEALETGIRFLSEMQEKLYAQDRWAVLLIFQAMDAAGKDGAIKHVLSGVNPQGCEVHSFKAPTSEELDHDFLWRCQKRLPERGRIGIFNRSYYEETLVVRVHPELLEKQQLPPGRIGPGLWRDRYKDIRTFESHLDRNGILVRKFFLHLSKKEQKKRFLARLDEPDKHWKFSAADVTERQHWKEYMHAYEETIRHTATDAAPWHVIPADNKWFTRLIVAATIIDALCSLRLDFPKVDRAKRQELRAAKAALLSE
jgi:PPK2 family polyphosphate:nucleotide phosphotransferase